MVVIAKCATTTTLLVLSKAHLLLYMAHVLKEQASLQDASVSKHKDSASITIICRLCVAGRCRISFCMYMLANLVNRVKKIFQLEANFYPGVHFMTRHELRETETYLMSDEGRLSSCTHSTRR